MSSSMNAETTEPVDGPVPTVEEQENEGQEGPDARNTTGGGDIGGGGGGGGSPVGVEDVEVPTPHVRVNVENLPPSEHNMPVENPTSLGGGNSPAASAGSSPDSSDSMGEMRRIPPGGGGGRDSGGDSSGGSGGGRELERVGSGGIDECQVEDSELSGSLDDDSRYGRPEILGVQEVVKLYTDFMRS